VSAEHRLFYYLATSQNDTANNPLIFWFNGGPGSSSLFGSFAEMGPYLINPDGETLRPNPDAWNKNASIVYLESPYWVGYSYSTNANETGWSDDKVCKIGKILYIENGKLIDFWKLTESYLQKWQNN
jgi:carboxypeptidase C (cathepsin A)